MTAREIEALADRWEQSRVAPARRDHRTAFERRMDAFSERCRAEAGPGCLPCLLEELE
jgi:hypothetical protein